MLKRPLPASENNKMKNSLSYRNNLRFAVFPVWPAIAFILSTNNNNNNNNNKTN